jgi:hypothetical protein
MLLGSKEKSELYQAMDDLVANALRPLPRPVPAAHQGHLDVAEFITPDHKLTTRKKHRAAASKHVEKIAAQPYHAERHVNAGGLISLLLMIPTLLAVKEQLATIMSSSVGKSYLGRRAVPKFMCDSRLSRAWRTSRRAAPSG